MSAEHNAEYLVWVSSANDPGYEPRCFHSEEEATDFALECERTGEGYLVTRGALGVSITAKLVEASE